ncbi:multi-sensor signal transduction histidine kinase [Chloroherpeton thalassium ATCC 35110]|uniref:histidine kinase n=1 Tax=Chloroherpeton thalassium (strain ATCC 35110 / GB-78) TaxID=517418 RepID=B3QRZ7_CHLT3|nr:PAS domain-containing hybrid sensor histidine kinase/response regulator [Chloroherpeton thalassium]ACF13942.1 multi-sensor signal transduction histidine kinase [Chloroherpeton thalassium ATCC 35110]
MWFKINEQASQRVKNVTLLLTAIMTMLELAFLSSFPHSSESRFYVIIAKLLTILFLFYGIYMVQQIQVTLKTYLTLWGGLQLLLIGAWVDLLEELVITNYWYVELCEHYGMTLGVFSISLGLFFWYKENNNENKLRYELATGAGKVGVWDWNLETNEFYVDPHLKGMLGYEDHEIPNIVDKWSELVHPEDREQMVSKTLIHLRGGTQHYEVVRRMIHKNGTIRWFLTRGTALYNDQGKPFRIVGTDTDISDRQKLEHQLLQSQKMEALGRLTGGVAHDFNNLLAVIKGSAELLEIKLSDTPSLVKQAKRIKISAVRGSELTNKLLGFSRHKQKQRGIVDINRCVETAIGLIESTIDKRIVVKTDLCTESPKVDGVENELELVFINMAINACDAMIPTFEKVSEGRLCFRTRLENITNDLAEQHELDAELPYVRISIADTGIGIAEDIQQEIFEPFFTTKESEKGTGLGLSMAYGAVKSHSGAITLESSLGYGTTFHIFLPVKQVEE